MRNYWKMGGLSLFSVPYAYVDHSSYLAVQLFAFGYLTPTYEGIKVIDIADWLLDK